MRKQEVIDKTCTRNCENYLQTLDPDYIQTYPNFLKFPIWPPTNSRTSGERAYPEITVGWRTKKPIIQKQRENLRPQNLLKSQSFCTKSRRTRELPCAETPHVLCSLTWAEWLPPREERGKKRPWGQRAVAASPRGACGRAASPVPGSVPDPPPAAARPQREPDSHARGQWRGTTEKANKSARMCAPWHIGASSVLTASATRGHIL